MTFVRRVGAALLVLAAGCVPSFDVPDGVAIVCGSTPECPVGHVCSTTLGRCVPVAAQGGVPPGVVAGSVSIEPATTNAVQPVTIRFAAERSLAAAPELSLRDPAGQAADLEGRLGPVFEAVETNDAGQPVYTYTYDATGLEAAISWRVTALLIGEQGEVNPAAIVGSVTFDFRAPELSGLATVSPPILRQAAVATIRLPASEPLIEEPAAFFLWPSNAGLRLPLHFESYDAINRVYIFSYEALGDEPQETATLTARLIDAAGNTSDVVQPGLLDFDFVGPEVADLPPAELVPPPNSPLPSVVTLGAGAVYRVELTLDGPVAVPPVVMLERSDLPVDVEPMFRAAGGGGTTYIFETTINPTVSYPQGAYDVVATLRDAAGNETHTVLPLLPPFVVDTVAPPAPAVGLEGAVVLRRAPWGTASPAAAAGAEVSGVVAAVEACAAGVASLPCACADGSECACPCTHVVVFDTAAAAPTGEIGRAPASVDGAFGPIRLGGVDRSTVYLMAVDAAGNRSDHNPFTAAAEASLVHDGVWIATLGGKAAGNFVTNPHEILAATAFRNTLRQSPEVTYEPVLAPSLGAVLGGVDDLALTVRAERRWLERVLTANRPPPRQDHAAAYDAVRDRLVLFGGRDADAELRDTWEWDGARWQQVIPSGAQPVARSGHAMAFDALRGLVLVFGGIAAGGERVGDTWGWDGTSWRALTPPGEGTSPSPRQAAGMVYDAGRGVVVLVGGTGNGGMQLSDVWEWDGGTWTEIQPAGGIGPEPRSRAVLAYVDEGGIGDVRLYGGGTTANTRFDMWSWDGGAWTSLGNHSGPDDAVEQAMAFDSGRQKLVLMAEAAYEWSGSSWIERDVGAAPLPRHRPAAFYDQGRGEVGTFGGRAVSGDCGSGAPQCADIWSFDGQRWIETSPLAVQAPPPRDQHVMTYDDATASAVMFGGSDGVGLEGTWEWTGSNWVEVTQALEPARRLRAGLAYDALHDQVVLFGGLLFDDPGVPCGPGVPIDGNTCPDTWLWGHHPGCPAPGPRCWAFGAAGGPPSRFAAAMEYHADSGKVVLYGGERGTASGGGAAPNSCNVPGTRQCSDTWVWDGVGWLQVTDDGPDNPGPRTRHAMTYDADGRRLVMFGGLDGDTTANCAGAVPGVHNRCSDTWVWGQWTSCEAPLGTRCWRQLTVAAAGAPPARHSHALSFDPLRHRVVLFGGNGDAARGDTWELNGLKWSEVTSNAAPPPRFAHAMIFDRARDVSVMFGGGLLRDTWELPSDPEQQPAALVAFDWRFAGVDAATIQAMRLEVSAGGRGYGVALLGNGAAIDGVVAAMWEPAVLRWTDVLAGEAPATAPEVLTFELDDGDEARALLGTDGRFSVAVRPAAPLGNGPEPAEVVLDAAQLEVRYRIP